MTKILGLPILAYIYITYVILPEIIIIFNCYVMTAIQPTAFAHLYSCNNNVTLKMYTGRNILVRIK